MQNSDLSNQNVEYNVFGYYPTYALLNELNFEPGSTNDLFIDLRNALRGTFYEDFARTVVAQYQAGKHIDYNVFLSIMEFIRFHKVYAQRKGIKFRISFFWESGSSVYHKHHHKGYKDNRKLSSFAMPANDLETWKDIFKRNLELFERIGFYLPDVHIYHLKHFEADFMPHYIITKKKEVSEGKNVIYSTDKDMIQLLNLPNTYIYHRSAASKKIITVDNFMREIIKYDENKKGAVNKAAVLKLFPLIHSITGDGGDDIPGIDGVAYLTCIKYFNKLGFFDTSHPEYTMEEFFDMFEKIVHDPKDKDKAKMTFIQKVLENKEQILTNYKLISYREISENVPLDLIKQINRNFSEKQVAHANVLNEALKSGGVNYDVTPLYY